MDDAARAGGCPYALRAYELEPCWSDQLVATLLGMRLREEEERGDGEDGEGVRGAFLREDECRVMRRAGDDGGEATVEVASREALEFALMRNGLEVPLTHGYRLFHLEPLPPHAHVRSAAHHPGVEPPLAMQLAPLSTQELTRRLSRLASSSRVVPSWTLPAAASDCLSIHTSADTTTAAASVAVAASAAAATTIYATSDPPYADETSRKRSPKACKIASHMKLVNQLVQALGGKRPALRCLGGTSSCRYARVPLVSVGGGGGCGGEGGGGGGGEAADVCMGTAVAALLTGLRCFKGWPESQARRKGVAAQNYLTLKRRDIAGFERWLAADAAESASESGATSASESAAQSAAGAGATTEAANADSAVAAAEAAEKAAAAEVVEMWRLSAAVFTPVVPEAVFDYLTITKSFRGSPHIDHKDTTYQHVMALGDFEGGELCTEEVVTPAPTQTDSTRAVDGGGGGGGGCDGMRTLRIDVKNRVGRIDGRTVWLT